MSRLVFRLGKLELRAQMGGEWGNYTGAWVEILRQYDSVYGREMSPGEMAIAAAVLTAAGSPPTLPELAASYGRAQR